MFVTMCREAYDDFVRFRRDREVNSQLYRKLTKKGNSLEIHVTYTVPLYITYMYV